MKKNNLKIIAILFASFTLISCGESSSSENLQKRKIKEMQKWMFVNV